MQLLFGSPEHKVLKVSYCDHAVSIVHLPLPTFYLVYDLDGHFYSDAHKTWSECLPRLNLRRV